MSLRFSKQEEKKLGRLLVRGFTKKQLAILESVSKDKSRSITSTSKKISEERKIPLSTVKLDLKILEQLGLVRVIDKDGFKKISMTKFGKIVLGVLSYYNNTANTFIQLVEGLLSQFRYTVLQR